MIRFIGAQCATGALGKLEVQWATEASGGIEEFVTGDAPTFDSDEMGLS